MTINDAIRQVVRKRARSLCAYCHSSEEASVAQFAVDHILPRFLGGSNHLENLARACQRCNSYRYNFTTAIDPHTQAIVPLFNPRTQHWAEHCIWRADGLRIVGTRPIGRATCHRLDVNDDYHNAGTIMIACRLWVQDGRHPPAYDPRYSTA